MDKKLEKIMENVIDEYISGLSKHLLGKMGIDNKGLENELNKLLLRILKEKQKQLSR